MKNPKVIGFEQEGATYILPTYKVTNKDTFETGSICISKVVLRDRHAILIT